MTRICKPDGEAPLRKGLFSYFLIGLLVFSLYLAYLLMEPFFHTIIFSTVITACSFPLYRKMLVWCKNREILASGIVIFILIVCFVIPLIVFFTGLIPQARDSIASVNHWLHTTNFDTLLGQRGLDSLFVWVRENLPFVDTTDLDVRNTVASISKTLGQTIIAWGTTALGDTLTFVFHFILMLLVVFFLLKDGRRIVEQIKYLSPLKTDQEDKILECLRKISRAVLVGGLLVAVLQGIVGGIGLAIVGIPPMFWGTVMSFCSLIPVVGTGLVWVPACLYLLIIGSWKSALFLLLWCALPVAAIDNFLRPYFMRDSVGVSVFFIFMSILGGIKAFGMLGVLYGPLILSFAMIMLTIYGEEFKEVLETDAG